jgi:hypothetical protein
LGLDVVFKNLRLLPDCYFGIFPLVFATGHSQLTNIHIQEIDIDLCAENDGGNAD